MKVLAAGKSMRRAPIKSPGCGRAGSLGRWASTRGTPACRATRTLGAPAQSGPAGGAGWRPGTSAAHGPGTARPARRGQQVGGEGPGRRSLDPPPSLLAHCSPVLLLLLRCRLDSPSLFLFLSFRFLFSNCVPGCSLGGAQAAEQLANSGQDRRRCRFRLLVPGKL